jgi:hypothetical protein
MFRSSSCPSLGEQYKADNTYGVQETRREEVVRCALVGIGFTTSRLVVKPILESAAARPVLYTIGVVGFVPFS